MLKRHFKLVIILALSFIVRLFFASFAPFKTDMDSFIAWGEQMLALGPAKFYSSGIWSDYAPGYMYFLWFVAAIKQTFFAGASREGYELLLKMVPIFFDIFTGALIYRIMRYVARIYQHNENLRTFFLPEIVSGIYLLSPFTFFNSAVWGQVDSVYLFFLLLSFFYLIQKKLPLAFAVYVIAGVIKPQAIVLAPLYMLILIKEKDWIVSLKAVLMAVASFYILTMPFFGLNALSKMWGLLESSIEVYPYSSINTFNYWGISGFWKPDTGLYLLGLTSRQFGYVLWGITLCFGFYYGFKSLYRKKSEIDPKNAALLASFFIFSAVMFMTRMHERYLFPLFGYLIVGAGIYTYQLFCSEVPGFKKNYTLIIIWTTYFVTVILHTINLYYVYIYYLYFLQEPRVSVPDANTLYHFIENVINAWSYIQLSVYVIFALSMPYYLSHKLDIKIKK